jgi:hypothetical protein
MEAEEDDTESVNWGERLGFVAHEPTDRTEPGSFAVLRSGMIRMYTELKEKTHSQHMPQIL